MILTIYKDSISYSLMEKSVLLKLGIITILGFLIMPLVLLFGYSYRVILAGLNSTLMINESSLPTFKNLKLMFIQGLKMIIVLLVYSIPPIIIFKLNTPNFNVINMTISPPPPFKT